MALWGCWKILVRVYVTDEKVVVFGPVWFVCVFHNVELSALEFVAFFQLCQTHSVALSARECLAAQSLARSGAEERFSFRARAWVQTRKHHLGNKRGAPAYEERHPDRQHRASLLKWERAGWAANHWSGSGG